MARVSYVAGYLIDFANAGDITKHTLPYDLTELCERLVTRWFKRREAEGKDSDGFNGGLTVWAKELNEEDKKFWAENQKFLLERLGYMSEKITGKDFVIEHNKQLEKILEG